MIHILDVVYQKLYIISLFLETRMQQQLVTFYYYHLLS